LTGPAGPGCRGGAAALTMVGGKTLVLGATGKVIRSLRPGGSRPRVRGPG
jgi:hypothetical protein